MDVKPVAAYIVQLRIVFLKLFKNDYKCHEIWDLEILEISFISY